MPNLPTITIADQAIWNRVYNAFGGDPVRYKEWLRKQLIEEVRRTEAVAAASQATTDLTTGIPIE